MSLLLVTHDRYFLEAVTNDILEIANGKAFRYKGSYSYYLEKKLEREENHAQVVEKAKNLMRKELDWIRRQPKARGTKAKYRIDAFKDIEKTAKGGAKSQELNIALSGQRLGKKILSLDKVSKGFKDLELFNDFSYTFKRGDRVGIVGKNGTGKSTLLKLINGKSSPDSGEITRGSTVEIGHYTQETLEYPPQGKVIDEIIKVAEFIKLSDGSVVSASQLLNQFNFSPKKQHDYVAKLSGGEKRRLQLLKVLMGNPNFLILDEPTNDLDLITLNTLEEYLELFGGCLIIVSHDRYFLDRLVGHLFILDGSGEVKDFPGNFTDYRNEIKANINTRSSKPIGAEPVRTKEVITNKLSYNDQREYDTLEGEIAALEIEKETINGQLVAVVDDYEKLAAMGKRLEEVESLIEEKEMRWLELSERV